MRRKLVAGNWKMNGSLAANDALVRAIVKGMGEAACQVAVQDVRTWLTTSAGVVVSRLQHTFESTD